jgi:hypothetical protein
VRAACLGADLPWPYLASSELNHPNLVRFVGAYDRPPNRCIVTEFVARCVLCCQMRLPEVLTGWGDTATGAA